MCGQAVVRQEEHEETVTGKVDSSGSDLLIKPAFE